MTTHNDITGDLIQSKPSSKAYRDNMQRIIDAKAQRDFVEKQNEKYATATTPDVAGSSTAEGERVGAEGGTGESPVGELGSEGTGGQPTNRLGQVVVTGDFCR